MALRVVCEERWTGHVVALSERADQLTFAQGLSTDRAGALHEGQHARDKPCLDVTRRATAGSRSVGTRPRQGPDAMGALGRLKYRKTLL